MNEGLDTKLKFSLLKKPMPYKITKETNIVQISPYINLKP